jgi:hypothetical protein
MVYEGESTAMNAGMKERSVKQGSVEGHKAWESKYGSVNEGG